MRYFSYVGKHQKPVLIKQIMGFLCLIITAPLYLLLMFSSFIVPVSDLNFIWIPFWIISLFLFSISIGSFYLNYFPSIWVDEEGLFLSIFFFFRLRIFWNEVIDISERQWFFDRVMLVRVKKFMPLHTLYSLFFSGSLLPGFLFTRSIEDANDLILEIRRRSVRN